MSKSATKAQRLAIAISVYREIIDRYLFQGRNVSKLEARLDTLATQYEH